MQFYNYIGNCNFIDLFFFQALTLNDTKIKVLEYVESRMSFIAPNVSYIVGPTVAAKLMGKIVSNNYSQYVAGFGEMDYSLNFEIHAPKNLCNTIQN